MIEYDLSISVPISCWSETSMATLAALEQSSASAAVRIIALDLADQPPPKELQRQLPELVIYDHGSAAPASAVINRGLSLLNSRYRAIWHPGVMPQGACLEELLIFLDDHPDIGISGPVLENDRGRLLASAGRLPSSLRLLLTGRFPAGGQDQPHRWLSQLAMLIRREVLAETGLLDEKFNSSLFDLDLCRRALIHGWKIARHPQCRAVCPAPPPILPGDRLHGGDIIHFIGRRIRGKGVINCNSKVF